MTRKEPLLRWDAYDIVIPDVYRAIMRIADTAGADLDLASNGALQAHLDPLVQVGLLAAKETHNPGVGIELLQDLLMAPLQASGPAECADEVELSVEIVVVHDIRKQRFYIGIIYGSDATIDCRKQHNWLPFLQFFMR
jgi:hypothetical protein